MATSVTQLRIDEDLKNQATAIFEELGLDLPTAVRMFLKRTVQQNGIPFSMTLPKKDYPADTSSPAARPSCRFCTSQ